MVAMHRIAEPFGLARDDYEIFSDLAERLGSPRRLHRRPHGKAVADTSL